MGTTHCPMLSLDSESLLSLFTDSGSTFFETLVWPKVAATVFTFGEGPSLPGVPCKHVFHPHPSVFPGAL